MVEFEGGRVSCLRVGSFFLHLFFIRALLQETLGENWKANSALKEYCLHSYASILLLYYLLIQQDQKRKKNQMKLVWSITSGRGLLKAKLSIFYNIQVSDQAVCFFFFGTELSSTSFLCASPLQLLICVSVRRHKQSLMQQQHFSIFFLNQLIINIDH